MNAVLDWFTPTRWIILGVVVLSVLASFIGYGEMRARQATEAVTNRYVAAIGKMKVEAAGKLADETKKVLALERALADATAKLEADYEKRRMDSRAAEKTLDAAAALNGGRLRDPNAPGCRADGGGAQASPAVSAASGAPAGGQAGGLLSAQLSGLLQRLEREADEVNDSYALCRAHAIEVHDKFNEERVGP